MKFPGWALRRGCLSWLEQSSCLGTAHDVLFASMALPPTLQGSSTVGNVASLTVLLILFPSSTSLLPPSFFLPEPLLFKETEKGLSRWKTLGIPQPHQQTFRMCPLCISRREQKQTVLSLLLSSLKGYSAAWGHPWQLISHTCAHAHICIHLTKWNHVSFQVATHYEVCFFCATVICITIHIYQLRGFSELSNTHTNICSQSFIC